MGHMREFMKVPHHRSRISDTGSKHWEAAPNDGMNGDNGGMNGDRGGDSAIAALTMVVREAIQK